MLDNLVPASSSPAWPTAEVTTTAVAGRVQSLAVFVGPSAPAGAEDVARRGGFAVVRVADAASAEAALSHRSADLIVLDSGPRSQIDFSACQRLASLRAGAILVITCSDDEVDRVLALELGADDCVSPRCSDRELMARMRALVRRHGSPKPRTNDAHVLRFSDFRLDRVKRDLRRLNGQRVPLSRSEYDLLHLFLSNPARLLTPADIRIACKGEQWLNPRNVAVRVYRLRRRLQIGSGHELIRTVHGVGYVLETPVAPG
ncbi:response regulator transcription factor [Brevundimonas sp.]|uniref:response regulator transcription factor n=1 Tax=Brevundimonas sp. TaxID=1871086 RepID=UPI002D4C6338|nr:response regulator transcription factor [Brevundimonas sp.]HYC98149.1 response regulator transcription factor [Brevundimonas sp.]